MLLQEIIKACQFPYNPPNPVWYSNNLREMMSKTKVHFNYYLLKEIHDGVIDQNDELLTYLPNVKQVLQNDEAYQSFSQFMGALRIDQKSLQNPSNAIRKVYNNFVNGTPQKWELIDPDEYISALKSFSQPQSVASENDRSKKIRQWEEMTKVNVQQFAANSYLTSGPCLDPRITNSQGQNTFHLLWYYLSGDEKIPYQGKNRISNDELSARERYFNRTYWIPFINYIGTSFGGGDMAFETDSTFNPIFDLIAELDRNKIDDHNSLITLNKLIDIVHGRGTISYLFIKGGINALAKAASCEIGKSNNDIF